MRWGRIYIFPTESSLSVPPTCLQGVWYARSLQSKYAAAASSASRVGQWHRARTLEVRLSRSWLALILHLLAVQTVPATHVGGAPPCAARTCLTRSCRRCSTRSSYCTLFNNCCLLSACSCVSQNMHQQSALAVRFSAFRLPNLMQTCSREVHGGLWPRLYCCTFHKTIELFVIALLIRLEGLVQEFSEYLEIFRSDVCRCNEADHKVKWHSLTLDCWAPSQYKDRLIYVWRFPC